MFFLSPLALVGLAAALVPPLLHLFQRRRPPDVPFPAVRYLRQTTREAQRSIRLRHLLLMLLRVAAVVLLVLAAARPVVRSGSGGLHEPTAVALIVDNSLSSGAVAGGTSALDELKQLARGTLAEAGGGDALWLIGADGIARRGTSSELRVLLDSLQPRTGRLEIGAAVRSAARLVASSGYVRGEVHLMSDLQASAIDTSTSDTSVSGVAILAVTPSAGPPPNVGVAMARPRPAAWIPGTGSVHVGLGGGPWERIERVGVSLMLGGRAGGRAVARPGEAVVLGAPALTPGWHSGAVAIEPDELRADDVRPVAIRVMPPARVAVRDSADLGAFTLTALGVLAQNGHVVLDGAGTVVIGSSASRCVGGRLRECSLVVVPPADPVRLGALNRALAAAGVPWRYGERIERAESLVSPEVPELEGARVRVRFDLVPSRPLEDEVLARAGSAPWLVRHDRTVLLGSRMVPEETTLPVSGAFVPALNAVLNRIARREAGTIETAPGGSVALPGIVTGIGAGGSVTRVEPGSVVEAPAEPGVYALLAGRDTVSLLVVAPDPRESDLRRADVALLRRMFPGASVELASDEREYAARRFRGAGRSELTGWFLAAALAVLLVEAAVAGGLMHRGS